MNSHSIIRIAYVDQQTEMGGAEHLLLTLLEGLPRDTVDPLLICPQDGAFVEEARQLNIPTRIVPLPVFYSLSWVVNQRKIFNPLAAIWNLSSILRSAWQLKTHLKEAQVDLVQTNSAFAHIYGGLAARLAGLPCIWYFHDLVERQRLGGTIVLVWKILAFYLSKQVVGVSDAVIQSLAVGSRGHIIYAGYKPRENKDNPYSTLRVNLALSNEAKLVGYIGRISYVKALDILAQSARQVIQTNPQIHFVLLGEAFAGEMDYKFALVDMIERMQLSKHWHWFGYDRNAAARIHELDILVLPSRREALGLVLIEAGWAGKASVSTRVGGIKEVVIDNETGLLVAPEDPNELAVAIIRLIENSQIAKDMGQKARERVMRIFDYKRYCVEFLELYASILG